MLIKILKKFFVCFNFVGVCCNNSSYCFYYWFLYVIDYETGESLTWPKGTLFSHLCTSLYLEIDSVCACVPHCIVLPLGVPNEATLLPNNGQDRFQKD